MNKILQVARREYIETIKTKAFIIGVLMAPLIVAGIIFFTNRLSHQQIGPRPAIKVALIDNSNHISAEMKTAFDEYNKSNLNRQILLEQLETDPNWLDDLTSQQKERLRSGQLNICVVMDTNIVEGSGKMHLYTCQMKASDIDILWTIENLINRSVVNQRCKIRNVSPELLAELRRNVESEQVELSAAGSQEQVQNQTQRITQMMVPFFFMYLMFLGVMLSGQQMLNSIIEEKTSRIIEVLLSALSPFQLMAGKILGLGAIGLTMMVLWALPAYFTVNWQGIKVDISPGLVFYFAVYYVLGFLFFSAILAGLGSVCNTVKEAQSLMTPVTLITIIPMLAWFNLVRDPQGVLARVLSFVPPLTPMVMVLRISASSKVPLIEIIASIILLVVSVPAVIWLSAKVFRTGILMYGKRPGLREIIRWLRQS